MRRCTESQERPNISHFMALAEVHCFYFSPESAGVRRFILLFGDGRPPALPAWTAAADRCMSTVPPRMGADSHARLLRSSCAIGMAIEGCSRCRRVHQSGRLACGHDRQYAILNQLAHL